LEAGTKQPARGNDEDQDEGGKGLFLPSEGTEAGSWLEKWRKVPPNTHAHATHFYEAPTERNSEASLALPFACHGQPVGAFPAPA
jgi:hypothetical protein